MSVIRAAVSSDIAYMSEQLKGFARVMETRRSLYRSDEYVAARLQDLIDNHVLVVSDSHGKLSGFIAGQVVPSALNPDVTQLIEILWWVHPEYRGTRVAGRLLEAFVERGRELAHWVMVSPCQAGDGADLALERAGFRLVERQYLMEVN